MRTASRAVLYVAHAGVAVTMLAHAAEPIKPDIRPGLWEVTSTPQVSGMPPISDEQLAKLPPESRAKFQAMMEAAMQSAAKPRVFKECMTPEKIARGFDTDKGDSASCEKHVMTSTASELQLHEECVKPSGKTVTDVHFQITGRVRMTGTVNAVLTSASRTMTINSTLQGKWLGADCGTVNP